MARRPKQQQLALPFPNTWGGYRKGAGSKPRSRWARESISHHARGELSEKHPVHVTIRTHNRLRSLRVKRTYAIIRRCFEIACDRFGFRLVQFSVQADHIHMICEADDRKALSRGLQGLRIRVAKALNKLWQRKGSVFRGRYHEHILTTPRQVRNALTYVLNNVRKRLPHEKLHRGLDVCASGFWFRGWAATPRVNLPAVDPPVTGSESWLLNVGWQRHGLIHTTEAPRRNH